MIEQTVEDLTTIIGTRPACRALGATAQPRVLRLARIAPGPPARALQGLQRAALALAAPLRQKRRVQPLATQQRTDLTRARARVGLAQDPQLVLRAEPPPARALDQLGVRRDALVERSLPLAYGSLQRPLDGPVQLLL